MKMRIKGKMETRTGGRKAMLRSSEAGGCPDRKHGEGARTILNLLRIVSRDRLGPIVQKTQDEPLERLLKGGCSKRFTTKRGVGAGFARKVIKLKRSLREKVRSSTRSTL